MVGANHVARVSGCRWLGECAKQATISVRGILWPTGAFLRFHGSPGVDAAWPERCRELEAWDREFPMSSPILSQFCPIGLVRQLRMRPRGTEISESRPILSHSVSLASGGRAMDRLFGNAHGIMVRGRLGGWQGAGCQCCKPILGTHRVGVGPAKGRAYNGRILNYDFIENSAPRVHLFW